MSREHKIPVPPFWGARTTPTREVSFAGMYAGMDLKTLYRLHWGARGSGEQFDALVRDDFEPRRLKMQREAEEKGWLRPTATTDRMRSTSVDSQAGQVGTSAPKISSSNCLEHLRHTYS